MKSIEVNSVTDILLHIKNLPINESSQIFRGQADYNWTLQPSIYRSGFKRYQAVINEKDIITLARPNEYSELEWLMACQHYGLPTRLLDWTTNVLVALFFACYNDKEKDKDGALFVCNKNNYTGCDFSDLTNIMNIQKLVFINTDIKNPRMQAQSGCFMLWGHSPLNRKNSVESYDLYEFYKETEENYFFEKILVPKKNKPKILNELIDVYSISFQSLFPKDIDFENNLKKIEEIIRLATLYKTDADKLTKEEKQKAKDIFGNCENMFHGCINLSSIS